MFVFSVLFMFVVTSCWDLAEMIKPFMVFPNLICASIMIVGMFCVPVTINNFRTSIIMKRITSSKITSTQFTVTLVLYYYVMTLISYLWIIGLGFLIFADRVPDYINVLEMVSVPELLYATTMSYMLSVLIGLFLLCVTKRNYVITVITVITFLVGFFLSPFGAPVGMVHDLGESIRRPEHVIVWTKSPLYYPVYINPFWYTTSMSYEAFFSKPNGTYNLLGSSIFNPTEILWTIVSSANPHIDLNETDKWLNLFVPIGLCIILAAYEAKYLKWNVR